MRLVVRILGDLALAARQRQTFARNVDKSLAVVLAERVVDATLDPSQYLDGKLVPPATGGVSGVEVALLRFVYFEGYAQAAGGIAVQVPEFHLVVEFGRSNVRPAVREHTATIVEPHAV